MSQQEASANIKFLDTDVPDFTVEAAMEIARALFGIEGEFKRLYSERDQNYRIRQADGTAFVFKFANSEEDPDVLDLQHKALGHIERLAPDIPIPRLVRTLEGGETATVEGPDGKPHIVRVLTWLPGTDLDRVEHSPGLLRDLGRTMARLDVALRGFYHRAADHELLWDLRRIPDLRHNTAAIADAGLRTRTEQVFDHFIAEVLPRLDGLRNQIIHNDGNGMNVLVGEDEPGRIAGVIDFGDMVYGTLIVEVAMAAAGVVYHKDDPVAAICHVAAGYDEVVPLEADEIDLLYDLVVARIASEIVICNWRIANPTGPSDHIEAFVPTFSAAFDRLLEAGRAETRTRLRAACKFPPYCPPEGSDDAPDAADGVLEGLIERRRERLGAKLHLFYERPLHMIRGEGVWLYDAAGRAYLDSYNNVPHVGHAHPHVVKAISRQAAALCTNTRYVYRNILDYADMLTASMPDGLDVCVFVNSGSEANDIAWRMAKAWTGHTGALVMEEAYHGGTDAIDALSPSEVSENAIAAHVRTLIAPDTYRGPYREGDGDVAARYAGDADRAIASLAEAGHEPAAFMIDSGFCTNGILDAPEGYMAAVADKLRAAGGIVIADEVQSGFGRMGSHLWGIEVHGVTPEIITLGKPVGDGHPIGVIATTKEILSRFTERSGYFSTFGGNPVACAAGIAVMEVIEREGLLASAVEVGDYKRDGMRTLMQRHTLIGDVRGRGLLTGVELVRDRATREPAGKETVRVMNHMRENGVLVGREGHFGNVLKIRPPLVFRREHADRLIEALDRALGAI